MKISYSTSLDDWMALTQYRLESQPSLAPAVRMRGIFWAAGLGGLVAGAFQPLGWKAWALAGGVALVIALWYPGHFRRAYLASVRRRLSAKKALPLFIGARSLEVVADGLVSESDWGSSVVRWTAIENVHQSPTHVFVLTRVDSGWPIPIAAQEPGAVSAFVQDIRRHIQTPS